MSIPKQSDLTLPELPSEGSQSIMVFSFALRDIQLERKGFRLYAAARAGDEEMGFSLLVIPAEHRPMSIPGIGVTLHRVQVEIRSEGAATDAFLSFLGRVFQCTLAPLARARPQLLFDAVSLRGDPKRLLSESVRLKGFYTSPQAPQKSEDAFELLLNLNVPSGQLQLSEKWIQYRPALVRALTFVPARDAN